MQKPGGKSGTGRVVAKYALLEIPSLLLLIVILLLIRGWVGLPPWLFWGMIALWIIKDVLMFPLVRKAYEPWEPDPAGSLHGARGLARERLAPKGYILVRGELWLAEIPPGTEPVEPGGVVRVCGRRDLVLLVEPESVRSEE